jgi:hypothetical protein
MSMIPPFSAYSKTVLGIVGTLYIVLGVFCTFAPEKLGNAMGYIFKDNGRIEFVVIYGGLEIGLGVAMLIAVLNQVLFPGVYVMTITVSLALPIFRAWMLLPGEIEGKMWLILSLEILIVACLILPLLTNKGSK